MGHLARLLHLLCAGGIRLFLQELSRNKFSNDDYSVVEIDIQKLPATQEVMV